MNETRVLCRAIVVGDECVGKTSIVCGLISNSSSNRAQSVTATSVKKHRGSIALSNQLDNGAQSYGKYSTRYIPTLGLEIYAKSFPTSSHLNTTTGRQESLGHRRGSVATTAATTATTTRPRDTNLLHSLERDVSVEMCIFEVGGRALYAPLLSEVAKQVQSAQGSVSKGIVSQLVPISCLVGVYDVTREESLTRVAIQLDTVLSQWGQATCTALTDSSLKAYIQNYSSSAKRMEEPPIYGLLLGNKVDSPPEVRQVTLETASHLARRYKMHHYECSPRMGTNVVEPFNQLVAQISSALASEGATKPGRIATLGTSEDNATSLRHI